MLTSSPGRDSLCHWQGACTEGHESDSEALVVLPEEKRRRVLCVLSASVHKPSPAQPDTRRSNPKSANKSTPSALLL